jgi:DNA-directed RNA polymerase specialized sigma subunit
MKSLEKRLKNIPEPDLTRHQSEKNCRFLKQFSHERRRALRELLRETEEAGRTPTQEEFAAALGTSTEEIAATFGISTAPPLAETKSQSERNAMPVDTAAANHDVEEAKAAVRAIRHRPRSGKGA